MNNIYHSRIGGLSHSLSGKKQNRKKSMVHDAVIESGGSGATTRSVANKCDMSVYSARNWLIQLENDGFIYRQGSGRSDTWHKK